jgi:sterol desaturase/sphingolipid hydroxylase (fatty acid hydroxylase superfamily)
MIESQGFKSFGSLSGMSDFESVLSSQQIEPPPATALAGSGGRSHAGLAALLAAGALLAAAGWYACRDPGFQASVGKTLAEAGGTLRRTLIDEIFLNPWFYGVFGLVLLLERLVPARPGEGSLSRGARTDFVWVLVKMGLYAWMLPVYLVLLRFLYDRHLGFLTLQSVTRWPWLARLVLALLFSDLLFWITHVVRHKVTFLWHFHAVHHSQRELNFFTEYRVHPVDDLFIYTIGFIPLFMVEPSSVSLVALVWVRHWHTRLYHANIRSDFGPLRYLLVTPQSHRVHHSIEARHHDRNFGLTFSLWDHLFGTQYRGYDEYPETGIDDPGFPCEQRPGRFGAVGSICGQFLYPFRAVLR